MRSTRFIGLCLSVLCAAPVAAETIAEKAPAARAITVGMQRHSAGTFYVAGAIEGYGDIRFLVDTGSSYMVINEDVLEELTRLGKAKPLREISGLMADGTRRVIPTYQVANLRLGDSCWIGQVEAAVIPGSTRPILGMEVLARLAPFTFSTDPAELVLNRCEAAPGVRAAARAVAAPRQTGVGAGKEIVGGEGVAQ